MKAAKYWDLTWMAQKYWDWPWMVLEGLGVLPVGSRVLRWEGWVGQLRHTLLGYLQCSYLLSC